MTSNENLRKQNFQLQVENYRLQLEKLKESSGSNGVIEEAVQRFAQQLYSVESLFNVIDSFGRAIDEDYANAEKHYNEVSALFEATSKRAQAGQIGTARLAIQLHNVLVSHIDNEVNSEKAIIEKLKEAEIPENDYERRLLARLLILGQRKRLASVLDFGTNTALDLIALAGTPEDTCEVILRDLRREGFVSMKLLERLSLQWIKEKIPDIPSNYSTIKEYLELGEKQLQSGKNAKLFADFEDKPPRTVERAVKLRKDFEALVNS